MLHWPSVRVGSPSAKRNSSAQRVSLLDPEVVIPDEEEFSDDVLKFLVLLFEGRHRHSCPLATKPSGIRFEGLHRSEIDDRRPGEEPLQRLTIVK